MARGDLKAIGPKAIFPHYVVAGGTRIRVGEPTHNLATWTTGAASVNTCVLAAADTPVIGTHSFTGIADKNALLDGSSLTLTQYLNMAMPVPYVGRIRGKAKTAANVDTASELAAIIDDDVLIYYNATGASDSGPQYTIHDDATANTSGLQIKGGNIALQTLDVAVAAQAYRSTVS